MLRGMMRIIQRLPNGALTANTPDNTTFGGNPRGANAVDWQTVRALSNQVASGSQSVVVGGRNNLANGANATVVGGHSNLATNTGAFIGGGWQNNCSGSGAFIGAGIDHFSSGTYSVVVGGNNNTAAGTNSFIGGGVNNNAAALNTAIAGGNTNRVDGVGGWCPGGQHSMTRGVAGRGAFAATRIAAQGDAQCGEHPLLRQTTDATATRLTADNNVASGINTINLSNFSVYAGMLMVVARASGGTDTAVWMVNVAAARANGVATTAMLLGAGAAIVPAASAGAGSTWRLDIAADITNGGIAVTATGAAATTINWSARFANVEVMTAS